MGCITSTEDSKPTLRKQAQLKIALNKGRAQQGVRELKQNYCIDKTTQVLGTGAFGKVFKSYNRNDPSIKVAIKVLDKSKMADSIDTIMEEIQVLNLLDHPNIVNHMETYDDINLVYIGKSSTKMVLTGCSDGVHRRSAVVRQDY